MTTPNRKLQRIGAGIVLVLAAAVSTGCAARASYEYDEPVVYRRGRVYSAPPPVVVYREHDHGHYHAPPPPRARVYRAPIHVHRPPPREHRREHRESRHDHDDDDRRHHR